MSSRRKRARPGSRPKPNGVFKVARSKDTVYVQVVGLGTMNNSPTFKGFADQMTKRGYRRFVCDLGPCRGVDSTFMGLLVGLGCAADGLVIVNVGAHCRKQLASVGLDQILTIDDEPCDLPRGVVLEELTSGKVNAVDRLKLIMRAHKALIRVDDRNERKFGAFLRDIVKNLGDDVDDDDDDGFDLG